MNSDVPGYLFNWWSEFYSKLGVLRWKSIQNARLWDVGEGQQVQQWQHWDSRQVGRDLTFGKEDIWLLLFYVPCSVFFLCFLCVLLFYGSRSGWLKNLYFRLSCRYCRKIYTWDWVVDTAESLANLLLRVVFIISGTGISGTREGVSMCFDHESECVRETVYLRSM